MSDGVKPLLIAAVLLAWLAPAAHAATAKGPGYAESLRYWRGVRSSLRSARSALRAGKRGAYERAVRRAAARI
jgi:hypothetical protein